MSDHVILGAMLVVEVILTLVGLRILAHVSEDARQIATISQACLDQIARLSQQLQQRN
jgi:hypothetical protein